MVKIQGKSDYDRLDELVHAAAAKFEWKINTTGWTRKTYDVYRSADSQERTIEVLARVESFATTNGEITIFRDDAMPFAQELGATLEKEFDIEEAVIVQKASPT
jgi:hypothetical protein